MKDEKVLVMTDEDVFSKHIVMGCYEDEDSRKAWEQADELKKSHPNWYVSVHGAKDGYHYVIIKK